MAGRCCTRGVWDFFIRSQRIGWNSKPDYRTIFCSVASKKTGLYEQDPDSPSPRSDYRYKIDDRQSENIKFFTFGGFFFTVLLRHASKGNERNMAENWRILLWKTLYRQGLNLVVEMLRGLENHPDFRADTSTLQRIALLANAVRNADVADRGSTGLRDSRDR